MNRGDVEKILSNEGFSINECGEVINIKNEKITNIIPIPIEQVVIKSTDSSQMYAKLNVVIDAEKEISNIMLPAIDVSSLKWIPLYLGMDAIVYPGKEKEFLLLVKKLFKYTTTINQYSSTGWVKNSNGEYNYLDSKGAIDDENIIVSIDNHLSNYQISREDINIKLAAEASLQLLEVVDKGIAYVLLSLVFLTPLLEFIGQKSKLPEFVVWLYGFTGTRKTSIAKLFASHFGDFNNRVSASFDDTYASMELKAHILKDSLMILDDFCPQQSYKETQNINTIAEKIVRAYGDRTSRARLSVSLESKTQFIPRGMLLVTGETLVPGNSTVARIVPLELKQDSVNLEQLTNAQDNVELLSICMREYISWLKEEFTNSKDELLDCINENYKFYLQLIKENAVETHGRTYEAFAWLLVGMNMMYQFYDNKGIVSDDKANEEINEAKEKFLEIIRLKDENSKIEDPVELFLDTIKELITSKALTIQNLDDGEIYGNPYKPIDGFLDSEYYYFNGSNINGTVNSKLRRAGIYFQLPMRGLLRELANRQIIKVEEKTNLPKKTIKYNDGNMTRTRMLHIRREFLC